MRKPSQIVDWRAIEGWLYPEEGDWLYEQIRGLPDRSLIGEVGAWMGRSTAAMALGCIGTHKHVITVDHFQGNAEHSSIMPPNLRQLLEAHLAILGDGYVTIVQAHSVEWANKMPMNGVFSFFFLDGSHKQDDVVADIRALRRLVRGTFAVHDAAGGRPWPGVKAAVEQEFAGLPRGEICSIAYFVLGGADVGLG